MIEITTHRLRQIIRQELIEANKRSEQVGMVKSHITRDISEIEIESFILTNPYFDETLAIQLIDLDFAGFHPNARIYD